MLDWKNHQLRAFIPKDGVLVLAEECRTWTLPTMDKFAVMKIPYFVKAAMALVFVEEEFHHLVAHPAPDVLNSAAFK